MSLAQVLFPPPTKQGLDEWAFAHYQHHLAIQAAALQAKKTNLPIPQIWPINLNNVEDWLESHQLLHNQANALFNVQGNDLSTFNWNDEKQREGFFYLNFQEHRSLAINSGLPI